MNDRQIDLGVFWVLLVGACVLARDLQNLFESLPLLVGGNDLLLDLDASVSESSSGRMFRLQAEVRRLRTENKLLLELLDKSKELLQQWRELADALLAEDKEQ